MRKALFLSSVFLCINVSAGQIYSPADMVEKRYNVELVGDHRIVELVENEAFDVRLDDDKCVRNVAMLSKAEHGIITEEPDYMLLMMICPFRYDYSTGYLFTKFKRSDIKKPVCSGFIDLTDLPGKHYWGGIGKIDYIPYEKGYFIVVETGGGDGGDGWRQLTLLYIDNDCQITRFYENYMSAHYEEDFIPNVGPDLKCSGRDFSFERNGMDIVLRPVKITCSNNKEIKTNETEQKINIIDIYKNRDSWVLLDRKQKDLTD